MLITYIVTALVRAMILGKLPLPGVHRHAPLLGDQVIGRLVDFVI